MRIGPTALHVVLADRGEARGAGPGLGRVRPAHRSSARADVALDRRERRCDLLDRGTLPGERGRRVPHSGMLPCLRRGPGSCLVASSGTRAPQGIFPEHWGAGFLPSIYQGTALSARGPIDNLVRSDERSDAQQRAQLDLLARLNRRQLEQNPGESDLAARIESFELAYRMQMAAPEALDVNRETAAVQRLYGLDNPRCSHFARQCLMARRLVERGVRFVQVYSGGEENERSWDGHQNIAANHTGFAAETDTPIAGLLTDLAARGLLESTLIVWCGEFGRLPIVQTGGTGRDHNPHAFTAWLAGAGVKAGTLHGSTDEIGLRAVDKRVSVHDLHATLLHLLGIDHLRLTYRYNGRDFRLTDVAGNVVREILG